MHWIVEQYHRDRAGADTGAEREAVWRMYCLAMIETDTQRKCGAIPWRRAASDDELPVRNPRYWDAIPLHDLTDLWKALERARHNPSAPDA